MTADDLESMNDAAYGLLFDVRRSVRYHDKRAAFFDRMHRVTNALTILLAGSVVFDIARPGNTPTWMQSLALAGALMSVADLVVGWSKSANVHGDLKRRFAELERRMMLGPVQGECWVQYQADRLLIEMDEPAVYKMLDTLCHNELLHASGFERSAGHHKTITTWQRLTCHLWPWTGSFANN